MPKLKTNKAARKRFRITRTGKVLGQPALHRHMLVDRSPKKKRASRKKRSMDKTDVKRFKALLPYG